MSFTRLVLISFALQVGLAASASAQQQAISCEGIFHSSRARDVRTFEYYKRWLARKHDATTRLDSEISADANHQKNGRIVTVSTRLEPAAKRFVILHEGVHSKTDVDLTREPTIEHAARAINLAGGNLNASLPTPERTDPTAPRVPQHYTQNYYIDEILAWKKEADAYQRDIAKGEVNGRPDLPVLKLRYNIRRETAIAFAQVTPLLLKEARVAIQKLRDGVTDFSAANLWHQEAYPNREDIVLMGFSMMAHEGRGFFGITIPVYIPGESLNSPTKDQNDARIDKALATLDEAIRGL